MAGIENAHLTILTVSSEDFFPTTNTNRSWVPLTTPFTFASTCTTRWEVQDSNYPTRVSNSFPDSCLPGGKLTHSPGICLSNYHIVEIAEFRTPNWTSGGLRAFGAACCTSDFTNTEESGFECLSVFGTPITVYPDSLTESDGDVQGATDNATILSSGTMYMDPMVVYWQESDLSKFDPDYAATLAEKFSIDFTPTATAEVTGETASPPNRSQLTSATSSAESDSNDAADSSRSGLNTGARAGIGVGVAIGVILLFVAGFLFYKRRLQKKAKLDQKSAIQNEQPEFVQAKANEA